MGNAVEAMTVRANSSRETWSDADASAWRPVRVSAYTPIYCLEQGLAQSWFLPKGLELPDSLVLTRPFLVMIEPDEEGSYVVSDEKFLVYGEGATRSEAVDDYLLSLAEYYSLVKEASDSGDDDEDAEHARLSQYVQSAPVQEPLIV